MPLDNIPPKWFEHFMSETPRGSSACQQRPTAKSEHASKCACSNCNHLKKKKSKLQTQPANIHWRANNLPLCTDANQTKGNIYHSFNVLLLC